MSKVRDEVSDIPESERKLHRTLTRMSAKIHREMRESDIGAEELADELDKDEEYVHRMLGGGINLSLRTIMELEVILDTDLIETHKVEVDEPKRRRRKM